MNVPTGNTFARPARPVAPYCPPLPEEFLRLIGTRA